MSNNYVFKVDGIVGEDCIYRIQKSLEEQLGKVDSFSCLSTKDGAKPSRYRCIFSFSSTASPEEVKECTFEPFKLMGIFSTPFFNMQKERLTPPLIMSMTDITVEEMADSAFGKGSHTAKKYYDNSYGK